MDAVAEARAVERWRGRDSLPPAGRRGSTGRWAGMRAAVRVGAGGGQQGRGGEEGREGSGGARGAGSRREAAGAAAGWGAEASPHRSAQTA
jgi:hypothetical protein